MCFCGGVDTSSIYYSATKTLFLSGLNFKVKIAWTRFELFALTGYRGAKTMPDLSIE